MNSRRSWTVVGIWLSGYTCPCFRSCRGRMNEGIDMGLRLTTEDRANGNRGGLLPVFWSTRNGSPRHESRYKDINLFCKLD